MHGLHTDATDGPKSYKCQDQPSRLLEVADEPHGGGAWSVVDLIKDVEIGGRHLPAIRRVGTNHVKTKSSERNILSEHITSGIEIANIKNCVIRLNDKTRPAMNTLRPDHIN